MPPAIPSDNRILYFARDRESFGFLSHFHPAPILLDDIVWPTVEHFYQAQKSFNRGYRRAILEAPTAAAAKRLAASRTAPNKQRKDSWFLKNNASPRPDWSEVKLDIMRRGDLAKFTQHADLRDLLLATGEAELIEDSPAEPYWGIGPDGLGSNWAGRVLMEVRARVRTAE
jgi:N-glycosidase YbiA